MKGLIAEVNSKVGERLRALRGLLLLSPEKVAKALAVSANTLKRLEKGTEAVNTDNLSAVIFFYGFDHKTFFDFSAPLPTEQALRKQMEDFHRKHKSKTYEIINIQPDLINLIEQKLLSTQLFSQWVTDKDVLAFCEKTYGYTYTSIPNTLDLAVKKGYLQLEEDSRPKRYKLAK